MMQKVSNDLRDVVTGVVSEKMRPFNVDRVDVALGPDHDGDTGVIINIYYRSPGGNVDTRTVARLLSQVRDKLWAAGEERFPYIRHHFPETAAAKK